MTIAEQAVQDIKAALDLFNEDACFVHPTEGSLFRSRGGLENLEADRDKMAAKVAARDAPYEAAWSAAVDKFSNGDGTYGLLLFADGSSFEYCPDGFPDGELYRCVGPQHVQQTKEMLTKLQGNGRAR